VLKFATHELDLSAANGTCCRRFLSAAKERGRPLATLGEALTASFFPASMARATKDGRIEIKEHHLKI